MTLFIHCLRMKIFLGFSAFFYLNLNDFCSAEATGTPKKPEIRGFCSKCPKNERPMDCSELMRNDVTKSGVYSIYPKSRLAEGKSLNVYCDMVTDGGGWTVIQRRAQYGNPEDYFVKNWNDYKKGFGNLEKEFWFGNQKLFFISNQGQYAIRFNMVHENGTSAYTRYENFWIANETLEYALHISEASGPAGDSLSNSNGFAFYTVDRPNLAQGTNTTRSGGWWRNGRGTSSLNGLNLYKTNKVDSADGITWETFGGLENSLEATEIKIRLKNIHLNS